MHRCRAVRPVRPRLARLGHPPSQTRTVSASNSIRTYPPPPSWFSLGLCITLPFSGSVRLTRTGVHLPLNRNPAGRAGMKCIVGYER